MKPTFRYMLSPAAFLPVYGKRAFELLAAMYTSSILDDEFHMKWHMLRAKGSHKLKMAEELLGIPGKRVSPVAGPDGRVGLACVSAYYLAGRATFNDSLSFVEKDLRKMAEIARLVSSLDRNAEWEPVVFPAEIGEVEASPNDFLALASLLKHGGKATRQATAKYGEERMKVLVGVPESFLEATKAETVLRETREECQAALYEVEVDEGLEKAEDGRKRCMARAMEALKTAAEILGGTAEEAEEESRKVAALMR